MAPPVRQGTGGLTFHFMSLYSHLSLLSQVSALPIQKVKKETKFR